MKTISLLLVLHVQDPGAASAAPTDVVVLEDGSRLEGRILVEAGDYLEMRIDAASVVGFDRRRVARIERGAGSRTAPAAPPAVKSRESWFVLHDGDGKPAGTLHETVALDDEGRVRIGEEWRLRGTRRPLEITILELATRELVPLSCFYHERSRDGDGRMLHERIVRAQVQGESLVVETRGQGGRQRRRYAFPSGSGFPLVARERMLRGTSGAVGRVERVVFDPADESLARRVFELRPLRSLEWGSRTVRARELVVRATDRVFSEWVDAAGASLRRQVNGPALVAVPASADRVHRFARATEAIWEPAMRSAVDGDFALWLPHPGWRFAERKVPGQVSARCAMTEASVSFVRLDHLGGGLTDDAAADAVVRWMRLVEPGFAVTLREAARLRDRPAVRIVGRYERRVGRALTAYRCELLVAAVRGRHLALCMAAPAESWAEAAEDFARIRDSVELYAETIAPPRPAVLAAGVR